MIRSDKKLRIIVADDDPLTLTMIRYRLEADGHEVVSVSNGWELLNKASAEHFDLIISDIFMPQLSGLQVTSLLKQFYSPSSRLILISHMNRGDLAFSGMDAGADAFIPKPIDPDELSRSVRSLAS